MQRKGSYLTRAVPHLCVAREQGTREEYAGEGFGHILDGPLKVTCGAQRADWSGGGRGLSMLNQDVAVTDR